MRPAQLPSLRRPRAAARWNLARCGAAIGPTARRVAALLVVLGLPLAGCGVGGQVEHVPAWVPNLAAANIGSVMVVGRTLPDVAASVISGRDCSAVRLDKGLEYCKPPEPPPAPPPYCTRSIGSVDCWRQPPVTVPFRPGVANGPNTLNAAQEANRTRRWPTLFNLF